MAVAAASARCQRFANSLARGSPCARGGEDLFRLHIEEAQPHRAIADDPFQMPEAAAAAEALFRVERHHRVARLPDAFAVRDAAETDAVAEIPDANQAVEAAPRGRHARRPARRRRS